MARNTIVEKEKIEAAAETYLDDNNAAVESKNKKREAAIEAYLNENVTVVIPRPQNVVGETDTTVTVNGVIYQIMYDVPVSVPRYVAEVIEHSMDMQRVISEIKDRNRADAGKNPIADL